MFLPGCGLLLSQVTPPTVEYPLASKDHDGGEYGKEMAYHTVHRGPGHLRQGDNIGNMKHEGMK